MEPRQLQKVTVPLANQDLCSRCCKWGSSGLLGGCWGAVANTAAPRLGRSGREEPGAARHGSRLAPGDPRGRRAVAKLAGSLGCQHHAWGSCHCVKSSCRFAHLAMATQSVTALPEPRAVSGLVSAPAVCPLSALTSDIGEQTKQWLSRRLKLCLHFKVFHLKGKRQLRRA